mmetsp:Transcript_18339/g.42829  ORF Transcript_18339/g.42829 Transcript_18339/m.42829 type:complete len:216 (-) Transcript_18339:92-739(-)
MSLLAAQSGGTPSPRRTLSSQREPPKAPHSKHCQHPRQLRLHPCNLPRIESRPCVSTNTPAEGTSHCTYPVSGQHALARAHRLLAPAPVPVASRGRDKRHRRAPVSELLAPLELCSFLHSTAPAPDRDAELLRREHHFASAPSFAPCAPFSPVAWPTSSGGCARFQPLGAVAPQPLTKLPLNLAEHREHQERQPAPSAGTRAASSHSTSASASRS